MDYSKIKLVIWDLDETLYDGVLSDDTAVFSDENGRLVRDLTDIGIVNAICSKNDETRVKEFLSEHGLWDFFVFNSINWTPKGERVRQIISEMALRDENVLFLDDNALNRNEAKVCCPNLMTAGPDAIPGLRGYVRDVMAAPDFKPHSRLAQYRILEEKRDFKAVAGSNEAFLRESDIRVVIAYDCENHIDRIHELILRTNQLNFTKVRCGRDELLALIRDPEVKTGYVRVSDRFGDYGIVGFFAVKDGTLVHFAFSCRTLNMGVEQYVYHMLDCPKLTVVGDVASDIRGGGAFRTGSTGKTLREPMAHVCPAGRACAY